MAATPALTRRFGWRTGLAVVAATLAAAVLAVVVEPTILRPLIQHVVQGRSGRSIDFSALRLALDRQLEPRLEFDDLVIQNASWAVSREPMVRARKVGLDLTWSGLMSGVWVVKRLVLEDGAVDLERDADGRRNGRLSSADGRGPMRARVLSIDGRRSRLQIVDRMTGFELRIGSTPLSTPRVVAGLSTLPLTRTLDFEGRQRGTPFSGRADVSDLLTLQRTGERFALQAEIRTDAARLTVSGAVTDLLTVTRVDADLHLDADPLSGLHPGLLPRLPPLRDIVADGHVVRDLGRWTVSRLHATSRGSAVDGDFDFDRPPQADARPRLTARLRAARLDVDEWLAADGARTARVVAGKAAGPASARKGAVRGDADAPGGASKAPFDWTGLGRIDAAIDLGIAELAAAKAVMARDTLVKATLDRSRLHVALSDSRIAGGHGSGEFRLDAASAPASASLDARLAGVRLRDLPPAWRAVRQQVMGGRLDATASVSVRGRSVAEWIGSVSGTARASLDGAAVSDRLEAKLGLDGLAFLKALVAGEAVPLRCAEVALDLHGGRGTLRRLTLDTARTAVAGSGTVDLVGRTLDVVLAPSSHVDALFALDRDIRIQGPLGKPRTSLQPAGPRTAAAPCSRG